MSGTAVKVGAVGHHMRGDAAVYKLDPPFTHTPWGGSEQTLEFVVVSAVDLDYAGFGVGLRTSETMIFPSDGSSVTDWGELAMVEHKSHADALLDLGYEVSS